MQEGKSAHAYSQHIDQSRMYFKCASLVGGAGCERSEAIAASVAKLEDSAHCSAFLDLLLKARE
jgi:hypothetical protein